MFKVVYNLKTVGIYKTLKDASKAFIETVKSNSATGLTYQLLETACWIERPNGLPIDFYTVRDNAIENGWLSKSGGHWLSDK